MKNKILNYYNDFLLLDIWEKIFLLIVLFYGVSSTIDIGVANIFNVLLLILFLIRFKVKIKNIKFDFLDTLIFLYFLLITTRFCFNGEGDVKTSIMVKFLIPIMLYYIVKGATFLKRYFNLILGMFFISMTISVLYSYVDKYNGVSRVNGFIFVMEFAEFAAMLSLGTLLLALFKIKEYRGGVFIIGISLISFISMIFTGTRGVWLAYILTLIIILFLKNKKYALYSLIIIALFLGVIVKGNVFKKNKYYKRFESIWDVEKNASNTTRLRLWKGSLEIIKDNAYFGVGLNNFSNEINKEKYNYGKIVSKKHAHNNYLQIGVLTGVLGLFLLIVIHLYIVYYFLRNYINKKDDDLKFINMMLLSFWFIYLFHGLTEVTIEDMYTSRLVWFLLGVANIMNKTEDEES